MDRLFEIHPSAAKVTFQNLVLREGFSPEEGGGIQSWSPGTVRLENVDVLDNLASKEGGGVNLADPSGYPWLFPPVPMPPAGRIEIVNSKLSGNSSGGGGAAINNAAGGTIWISHSRVVDNPGEQVPDPEWVDDPLDPYDKPPLIPAPGVYFPDAPAIVNQGQFDIVGTVHIADSFVEDNIAHHDGAGVSNLGHGSLIIERSTFKNNTTEADGGAIYSAGGTLTISDSTVAANSAHSGGGVYSAGDSSSIGLRARVTITNTRIAGNAAEAVAGNVAEADGGGIVLGGDAQVVLTDVTIAENEGTDDGGGFTFTGRASLVATRLTVKDNKTEGGGGGGYIDTERPVVLKDSTFSGNKAGIAPPPMPGDVPPLGCPGCPIFETSGNVAGGGALYTEGGPMDILNSTFTGNVATDEGGAISIDNFGPVTITDSVVRANLAGADGGGIENSGMRVTFTRLLVEENKATLDGGGIYNSSSGDFLVIDSLVQRNTALDGGGFANAPDADLIIRQSTLMGNTARMPGIDDAGQRLDGGEGGGFWSKADGDALIENTTISHNKAGISGGGLFHDADGELRLSNVTVWANAALAGGGIGVVESDFAPEVPPKANESVVLRNSIVGGSTSGGSCDWYVTSEGGNVSGGSVPYVPTPGLLSSDSPPIPAIHSCFTSSPPGTDSTLLAEGERDRLGNAKLDAIADNGGPTPTNALRYGSLAIDTGLSPCPLTDQRGVKRPQNDRCDAGAFEFVGPPPPFDGTPPDTQYLTGPIQDTLDSVAFTFTGSDDQTPADELQYECRLTELELTEAPEPLPPWEPVPPELMWGNCLSPWSVPPSEEGLWDFEVRAIDRAGNVDPTPAVHHFDGADTSPPQTIIEEAPPLLSNSRAATFTFTAIDNITPAQFMEYECRLDTRDPDLWVECFNPFLVSNLTTGQHTFEVRAIDAGEMIDPTPARYTWTVGQPGSCDLANITLTATADGWVDQVNPTENYVFANELTVRGESVGDPNANPPEPVIGQNARTLVRFDIPSDAPSCRLESATLRLYAESTTAGEVIDVVPLVDTFKESTLTWFNQPGAAGSAVSAESREHAGYMEWDVTGHVRGMRETGLSYGWRVFDHNENDPEGGDQSFASRELLPDPPESFIPELVLVYEADTAAPPPPPTLPPNLQPTTVHCGQVLREHTVVGNDLFCELGEGLSVAASDVVIDLNGHTISGPDYILGNVSGQEEGFPAGIRVSGQSNVVVRNGTVKAFGWGVLLTPGTTRTVIENLSISRNAVSGVELFDADNGRTGNTIRNNRLTDNELGVTLLSGAQASEIVGNTIHGSLGEAILIQHASGHLIEDNEIVGIPTDPNLDSDGGVLLDDAHRNVFRNNILRDTGDAGFVLSLGSNENRLEGNEMYRNGDAGVFIQDSARNEIVGNLAHQESDGGVVLSSADGTVVQDNDLRYNPNGIETADSNDLVIEGNDASNSTQDGFAIGNGVNIVVRDNVANLTGGTGISLEGATFDSVGNPIGTAIVDGNTANENDGAGIAIADGAGHLVRSNSAYHNAEIGISADGNRDGGGNLAAGNGGNPGLDEQCLGVVCAPGDPPPLTRLTDTTAPETTIDSGPVDPTPSTSASFTFSATDLRDDGGPGTPLTGLVYECRLDAPPDPPAEPVDPGDPEPPHPTDPPDVVEPIEGEGWMECITPVHYTFLEPGEHHFEVRAMDQADPDPNKDLTPAVYEWTIDPLAEDPESSQPDEIDPETRIDSGPAAGGQTASTSASFGFAGSDNLTLGQNLDFECRLDGSALDAWVDCSSPKLYEGLSPGPHVFEVRAIDRKGNKDATPAFRNWTIIEPPRDTTAPETDINSAPDGVTVLTEARFTFSSDDPLATFECSLNLPAPDNAWAACPSPKEYPSVPVGSREFQVRAIDAAGNVDQSPAVYRWQVGSAPVPGQVYCGQSLKQSTIVTNDLADCLWDGLVVGAPNITIDLNGHTIDGKGLGAGIRNDGHDNVTIKNGRVVDFDFGVALNPGTEKNIVELMTLEQHQEAAVMLGQPAAAGPGAEPADAGAAALDLPVRDARQQHPQQRDPRQRQRDLVRQLGREQSGQGQRVRRPRRRCDPARALEREPHRGERDRGVGRRRGQPRGLERQPRGRQPPAGQHRRRHLHRAHRQLARRRRAVERQPDREEPDLRERRLRYRGGRQLEVVRAPATSCSRTSGSGRTATASS